MSDHDNDKKKAPIKVIMLIAGMLVVEAALIVGLMTLVGGDPDVAAAGSPLDVDPEQAEQEKIVEVLVLDAKLANAKTGVGYLYSTEIYVQVKTKHAAKVEEGVEQFYNEIKAEISAIWRTSDPHHFQEPRLETLTRKVYALLSERFGLDADGEPMLVKCVIVMGTGLRVDY